MHIYAYKNTSESAKKLAKALGCKIIKHEGSVFQGDKRKPVINWGSSNLPPEVKKCRVINKEKFVSQIVNKDELYNVINSKWPVPLYTKDAEEAQRWIDAGVKVVDDNKTFIWDVKADGIFRLHFIDGQMIKAQQKQGNSEDVPKATREMITRSCRELVAFLGLDFAAVTVGYVNATGMFYILAVNTAPSLDSELAVLYANYINLFLRR